MISNIISFYYYLSLSISLSLSLYIYIYICTHVPSLLSGTFQPAADNRAGSDSASFVSIRRASSGTCLYGGSYFVRVLTFHGEVVFAERYGFGCNFWFPLKINYTQSCTVWRCRACRGHKQSRSRHMLMFIVSLYIIVLLFNVYVMV